MDYSKQGRSPPIDIPGTRRCPYSQWSPQYPERQQLKPSATTTTPPMDVPFLSFPNVVAHPAGPSIGMDHARVLEKLNTPPFLVPLRHESQNGIRVHKDAEVGQALKARAIRNWKIIRRADYPPPRFATPSVYPYTVEDFEDADDYDNIRFTPLDEGSMTRQWWSDDVVSYMAPQANYVSKRQDAEGSLCGVFQVKTERDLAAWRLARRKDVQSARKLVHPKRPEPGGRPKLGRSVFFSSAQKCMPTTLQRSSLNVAELFMLAVNLHGVLVGLQAPIEEACERPEGDSKHNELSWTETEQTDEEDESCDGPSPGLYMSPTEKYSEDENYDDPSPDLLVSMEES